MPRVHCKPYGMCSYLAEVRPTRWHQRVWQQVAGSIEGVCVLLMSKKCSKLKFKVFLGVHYGVPVVPEDARGDLAKHYPKACPRSYRSWLSNGLSIAAECLETVPAANERCG